MRRAWVLKTLLLEADPVAVTLLAQVLKSRGHEVLVCTTASEAWAAWSQEHHRLVLMDWDLATNSTPSLAANIRSTPAGESTVIVAVTAEDRPGQLQQILHEGADDYVGKTANLDLLQVRVTVAERHVTLAEERGRYLERLRHDAVHDSLTGLPNRNLLLHRLSTCLGRTQRRSDYNFAVLFLDVDRFKLLNESLGHVSGDRVLKDLAKRLKRCVRPTDTVARMGGDEFAVLLDDITSIRAALTVSRRISRALEVPFQTENQSVFSTVSIGIVLGRDGYSDPEELLRDADAAMYRAKAEGSGRYAVFDKEMLESVVTRLQLETELRTALNEEQFNLVFQPIFELPAGRITGVEALLRWDHPTLGSIPPNDFIPIAEDTGMIVPLGDWVLRSACSELGRWRTRVPGLETLRMNVNISGRQLLAPELPECIEQALDDADLEPEALALEITENVFVENGERAEAMLKQLSELGVELQMDDFGTGYSSLGYLHRLPIDVIKIDKSFVQAMEEKSNGAIVQGILDLASSMGLGTVAEGVETKTQLQQLRGMACTHCQGFLLSKPIESSEVLALLGRSAVA